MENHLQNKKIMLYLHHDIHNIIDEHIIYQLKNYHDLGIKIIFISNSNLSNEELHKVTDFTIERILHHNRGYDFSAWKDVILSKGKNFFTDYDDLIITNSTCYGPIFSFEEMFNEMDSRNADFWGVGVRSPYMGFNYHIGSYFVSFSKKVFTSQIFWKFWKTIKDQYSYWGVIRHGELRLSAALSKQFKYDVYSKLSDLRPCEKLGHHESFYSMSGGYFCEKAHSPLLKVKSFYNQRENLYSHAAEIFAMLKRIETNYPLELIINHQKRTSPLSWLRNFPNFQHLVSENSNGEKTTELEVFIKLTDEKLLNFYQKVYQNTPFKVKVAVASYLIKKVAELNCENWELKVIPSELHSASWGKLIQELFPKLLKGEKIILVNTFKYEQNESEFFNERLQEYNFKSLLNNHNFMQNAAEILAKNSNCGLLINPIAPELIFCDKIPQHSDDDVKYLKNFYNQLPYPIDKGVPSCMQSCAYIKSNVLKKLTETDFFNANDDEVNRRIAYALQKILIDTNFISSETAAFESNCKYADYMSSSRKFGFLKHLHIAIELGVKNCIKLYHKMVPPKITQKLMYFEEPFKAFLKKHFK